MSDAAQAESSKPQRSRPRFSLLTLLFLTTIAALGIAVWRLGSEVVPLREEVKRLREEVGSLVVEDESKLCATQVRTADDLTWKWRVWIPQGKRYQLRTATVATGMISKEGYGKRGGTISLSESGELWVQYQIRQDPRDNKWYGTLSWKGGSVGKDIQDWVTWPQSSATGGGVGYLIKVHDSNKPLDLIRHRVSQTAADIKDIEDPSAGFHVWIEEK